MKLQIANCRLLMAALFAVWHAPVGAEVIERVMAVASGELILQSDVTAARELGLVELDTDAGDPTRDVLSRLIDRALILAEVDRFAPPEPDAAAIDRGLADVRARFASAESFAATLARVGMDERHLRETLRQNLRIDAYVSQRFTAPPPGEDELGRYYQEHPDAFTRSGILQPFETVRPQVVTAVTSERRRLLVEEWLSGLRRRADIRDLYAPAPSGQ